MNMRSVVAACMLVLSSMVCAQSVAGKKEVQSQIPLKTFTNPDGAFQFNYPEILIVCQQQTQGARVPAKNCSAYHPVCDAETPEKHTGIACLAYPKNKFTDTDAFEAATFSVEVLDRSVTEQDCLAKPPDELFEQRARLRIHGVSFAVFEFGEGGMNQSVGGHVYRAFHGGKCYQLGINAATANADVFDPPARELTKEDWAQVNGALEQARDSFRFLH